jgi:hypothetical protein
LTALGKTYEVRFSSGQQTLASVASLLGLKQVLGVDDAGLKALFAKYGCSRQEWTVTKKSGSIVNIDMYQTAALVRELAEKYPQLEESMGLYNLRGSRKVYDAYGGPAEYNRTGVWWMWTGEQWVKDSKEEAYVSEGLVKASELQHIRTKVRFCSRGLGDDYWYYGGPGNCDDSGGLVLGGLI